jgi:GAF domain-containing protein
LVEENEQFGSLPERVRNVLLDARRLDVLRQIDVWIGEKDAGFDALTRLAASVLTAPAAFIATVGPERLQFRSSLGWGMEEASAAHSFCAHTISRNRPMIVEDAVSDPRFSANPFVTGDPRVRFYAGAPIRVRGQMIGTIAVLDEALRQRLTAGQVEQLESLAMLAASLFDLKETRRQGEKAERALWREEKRHALALKAASVASWIWDVKAGTFECDNLLPKLFNLPPAGRIAASDIFRRVDPRDVRKTEMPWRRQRSPKIVAAGASNTISRS